MDADGDGRMPAVRIVGTGIHHVFANYPGDENFLHQHVPTIPLMATQGGNDDDAGSFDGRHYRRGTPVMLTANVTPHAEGTITTTGSVSFTMESQSWGQRRSIYRRSEHHSLRLRTGHPHVDGCLCGRCTSPPAQAFKSI